MDQSWQSHFGPLFLPSYIALPDRSKKHFLKFSRAEDEDLKKNIRALSVACTVLGVNEENVFVRLFVEFLFGSATTWFQHLEEGSITR